MKLLFDQGTPAPLRRHLRPHSVDTTSEMGWSTIANGELLRLAEEASYCVFVTTDQNIHHQQNLSERTVGIVVLMSTSWPRIRPHASKVMSAVERVAAGGYEEVTFE